MLGGAGTTTVFASPFIIIGMSEAPRKFIESRWISNWHALAPVRQIIVKIFRERPHSIYLVLKPGLREASGN
jgi:hypothetical protein